MSTKLRANEDFECFPDGKTPFRVEAGKEFEIPDDAIKIGGVGYAEFLVGKGHAEIIGAAPAAKEKSGAPPAP